MYMTAARPPPAVQRRVSKRSATDRKRIHIFNKQHKTKQIQGQHTARIGKTDFLYNHPHDHPDQDQDFYFKATYRYVDVPLYGLLDKDGPRIKIDRYLGEDVEDHGQDCQVH